MIGPICTHCIVASKWLTNMFGTKNQIFGSCEKFWNLTRRFDNSPRSQLLELGYSGIASRILRRVNLMSNKLAKLRRHPSRVHFAKMHSIYSILFCEFRKNLHILALWGQHFVSNQRVRTPAMLWQPAVQNIILELLTESCRAPVSWGVFAPRQSYKLQVTR